MIVEFHDNQTDNLAQGTLRGRVGHDGTVEHAYQAEMWLQEVFGIEHAITRAYVIGQNDICAILKQDNRQKIEYVGRSPHYSGEWQLPFAYAGMTAIATTILGETVKSVNQGAEWAAGQLQGDVACAALLDEEGMLAAWEKGPSGIVLVARSPRPIPTPK